MRPERDQKYVAPSELNALARLAGPDDALAGQQLVIKWVGDHQIGQLFTQL